MRPSGSPYSCASATSAAATTGGGRSFTALAIAWASSTSTEPSDPRGPCGRGGQRRMPSGEERRRAVCGRTACTDRCGGGRKRTDDAPPLADRGVADRRRASRRPYSELVGLRVGDVHLGTGAHIRILG